MLEEVGCEYELRFVDLMAGEQKSADHVKLNPMGKLPTLLDGDAVITEGAAIGLYLADRYALGRLSPALDDPRRGEYFRWALYGPSVVEPCVTAKGHDWDYKPAQVGWGTHEAMLSTLEHAIGDGPWLLGETFTMADLILGQTVRWLMMFGMLEKRPSFEQYAQRLGERPAVKRGDAINERIREERGLPKS
jgi:glutathione S-transferase